MPRTQKEDGSLEAGKMGSNGTRISVRPVERIKEKGKHDNSEF